MILLNITCLFLMAFWPKIDNCVVGCSDPTATARRNRITHYEVTLPKLTNNWLQDKKMYDLNKDGTINFIDYAMLMKN